MKDNDKRFAIIIILLCLLACSFIGSYFYYETLTPAPDNLARLKDLLSKTELDTTPATSTPSPAGTDALLDKSAEKPKENTGKVEFNDKLNGLATTETTTTIKETSDKDVLPPPRLAPNMFIFSTLVNDAPISEFPLVLVGQKSLDWYRTRSGNDGGGAIGVDGNVPSSIYSQPPTPTPTPPAPNPPTPEPPPTPPPKPPRPPPEVSPSGL